MTISNPCCITWACPLRTGCQCAKAAAPPLVGSRADSGRSPAEDSEEAHVQDLTLQTHETRVILGLCVAFSVEQVSVSS